MKCVIYKGDRKQDTYLYIEREGDFSRVPEALLKMLGVLEWVMALELTPERTLVQADPEQVRRQLTEQGYYLQMPPQDDSILQ
ncbi:MAG: YcgL domain-containing protein [Gammaproteobacteria bacterium]|nr:YcgL domain-containing protein [Gammaproteobacteria bacterium]